MVGVYYSPELLKGQDPEKVVVCCSDSRESETKYTNWKFVPGKIFVIRNAGNCALFPDALASLKYSVLHLNIKEIEIAGHYDCGMMKALKKINEENDETIREVGEFIISKIFGGKDNIINKGVNDLAKINVINQIEILSKEKVIKDWLKNGGILKGTYFDFSKKPLVIETLVIKSGKNGN